MESIMKGNYNKTQIEDAQREMLNQIKLANIVIQGYAVASKNKRAMVGMTRMNFMDDQVAINLGLAGEIDNIKCEVLHRLITREQCLDTSGEQNAEYDCSGCQHYNITKNVLMGSNE
jgi:hypothetical protein